MASKKVVDEFYKKNLVLKYIKERMGKEDYDKFIKVLSKFKNHII